MSSLSSGEGGESKTEISVFSGAHTMSPPHISEGLNRGLLGTSLERNQRGPKLQPSIIAQGRPLLDFRGLLNPLKTRLQMFAGRVQS